MKKNLIIVLTVILLLLSTTVFAEGYFKRIDVLFNDIKVEVAGTQIKSDTEPFIYQDRVFVPLRSVAEGLGCEVAWDSEAKKVFIDKYIDFPESDYLNGEIFVYGLITKIDHDNKSIEIEQHFDDNSMEVTPVLGISEDAIIIIQRNNKKMNIEFSDLKCGDGIGAVINKDGFIRGIIMNF